MDEHGKLYWHEAFYEALQLELCQYRDVLEFIYEHQLSKEALRMDVLVIKKDKDIQIEKNIGRIFKKHNIFEYKSESDSFSARDYNKILGYAFLYSSFEKIPMSEITLSVSLTMYPRELMKHLENERDLKVKDLCDGIHYEKNVYLDRLVRANPNALMEAMNMSEAAIKIILEGAKKHGWLEKWVEEERKKEAKKVAKKTAIDTAKKMLQDGEQVEKIARWTDLSVEEILKLQ